MTILNLYNLLVDVSWMLPSQVVLSKDSLVREVISPDLLKEILGLHYLHEEVATSLNPALLDSLGIQTLGISHLIEFGKVWVTKVQENKEGRYMVGLIPKMNKNKWI